MILDKDEKKQYAPRSKVVAVLLYLVMTIGLVILARHCVWFDWSR